MIMNAHDARLKTESAIKERESAHEHRANELYYSILKAVETSADIGESSVRILWPSRTEITGACPFIGPTTYEGMPALIVSEHLGFFIRCVPDVRERLVQAGFTVELGQDDDGNDTIRKVTW